MPTIQRFARPVKRRVTLTVPREYDGYAFEIIMVPVKQGQKKYDFSCFAGKVKYPVDGVAFQRQIRDEW